MTISLQRMHTRSQSRIEDIQEPSTTNVTDSIGRDALIPKHLKSTLDKLYVPLSDVDISIPVEVAIEYLRTTAIVDVIFQNQLHPHFPNSKWEKWVEEEILKRYKPDTNL